MKLPRTMAFLLLAWLIPAGPLAAARDEAALTFGVIKARSAVATAQQWNPILRYVSERSAVPLKILLAKSGAQHADRIRRGEPDFIYSNYQFAPGNSAAGYIAIARPLTAAIRSQIVVPGDSPIYSLDQLRGRNVAFSSEGAFAGYQLPMDALRRAGIDIVPQFAGTLEGALGHMLSGRSRAAVTNPNITLDYAANRGATVRVLWSSEEYPAIPVAVHPRVPAEKVAAVRTALLQMADDSQGRKILAASTSLFGPSPLYGFTAATENDFDSIRRFYRNQLPEAKKP